MDCVNMRPLAPPPHFAALRVEHDDVVGLTAWEAKLYALAGAVRDVEAELDLVADFDVERCGDRVACTTWRRRWLDECDGDGDA